MLSYSLKCRKSAENKSKKICQDKEREMNPFTKMCYVR